MAVFEKLIYYLQYPFVQYALITGVFISLSTALLGVPLVLKRMSFLSTGLSNFAFAMTTVVSISSLSKNLFIVLGATILCAVYLLCFSKNDSVQGGDARLAVLSVGALSVGYIVLSMFSSSGNVSTDVCTILFGATTILTLSSTDVMLCIGLSVLVVLIFIIFYKQIFTTTFDADFGKASGVGSGRIDILIAVITAVVIVLALNLVGSLLISALIVLPVLSAMTVVKTYRNVVIFSAIYSVICSLIGLCLAILLGSPVGATIVVFDLLVYSVLFVISKIRK
jgi:zinc transport system permease protein